MSTNNKKILITGATGFIGRELGQKLTAAGFTCKVVSRHKADAEDKLGFTAQIIEHDLNLSELPTIEFDDVSAVIHLAGESIDGRWTEKKKQSILASRESTSNNLLKNIPVHVKTVLSVSAQGIYSDQGEMELTEDSKLGSDFLADVCKRWERPFLNLMATGERQVAIFRLGLVLSAKGGALHKMIPIFKNNLGASIGSGTQWVSWIHLHDVCAVFQQSLTDRNYAGVFNLVTNHPVRNAEFTKTLCQNMHVFQLPAVPQFVIKTLFGEMSTVLLSSIKVLPAHLNQLDYQFKYANLDEALKVEINPA